MTTASRSIIRLSLWSLILLLAGTTTCNAADRTIQLGQTLSIKDSAATTQLVSRVEAAYFRMINDEGGVNGRSINLISLDDGNDPHVALAQTRRLIEEQHALAIFGSMGAGNSGPVQEYLNSAQIPQLFVNGRTANLAEPLRNPWTIAFDPSYAAEGALYGGYLRTQTELRHIAVLRADDASGMEYVQGLRSGLGSTFTNLVTSDTVVADGATIARSVQALHTSGVDTLLLFMPAALLVRLIEQIDAAHWHGTIFIPHDVLEVDGIISTISGTNAVVSMRYLMDPRDPTWGQYSRKRWHFQEFTPWQSQPGVPRYIREFTDHYLRDVDPHDPFVIYGYTVADLMFKVLQSCGDDLTRENLMIHAANLRGITLPLVIPGIHVSTSPRRYTPLTQGQLIRYDGQHWIGLGPVLDSEDLRQNSPFAQ